MKEESLQVYEETGGKLLAEAQGIVIIDDASREYASVFSNNARRTIKAIKEEFDPDIQVAHSLHRDLLARKKRLIDPFDRARLIVDREIGREHLERERIRREAEQKERERVARELLAAQEAADKKAEKLLAKGEFEEAEEVIDKPIEIAPEAITAPVVDKTTRSEAGTTTVRKDHKLEVVNKMGVLKAIVAGLLPSTLVTIDVGAAKQYAKAAGILDREDQSMPGFKITETAVVSGRTF